MIFYFDKWAQEEKDIYSLYKNNEFFDFAIVNKDDGFIDDGAKSIFRYYVNKAYGHELKENPLFANNIKLPGYWEIIMFFDKGELWDDGIKKAEIEYSIPVQNHFVKAIKWLINDRVYKIDNYDKYGNIYYSDYLDDEGKIDSRIYLANNKAVIMYQPKFDTYIIYETNKVCKNTNEFICDFVKTIDLDNIVYTNTDEIKKVFDGTDIKCGKLHYYVNDDVLNKHNNEILVLTNSDQVEKIEYLVSKMSQYKFHIGALTLMSNKLLDLRRYGNVELYECINKEKQEELFNTCSYYLDINHYEEICDAVRKAFVNRMLICGFKNTIHSDVYILNELIYDSDDVDDMISKMNSTLNDSQMMDSYIHKQNIGPIDKNEVLGGLE